jgi:ubiquinone/menaquinone biosynthesis C-methylase UbiE
MSLEPRSTLYDGFLYSLLADSQMKGLHRVLAKRIPENIHLLDACCGTGAFVFHLAPRVRRITGVDLSPRMISYARARKERNRVENVRFEVGDVSSLDAFDKNQFDLATVVNAVHEMPPQIQPAAVRELLRVARKVLFVDFHVPLRFNLPGLRNRLMEILAGPRHLSHFLAFSRMGGLPTLLREADAEILDEKIVDRGNKYVCTAALP